MVRQLSKFFAMKILKYKKNIKLKISTNHQFKDLWEKCSRSSMPKETKVNMYTHKKEGKRKTYGILICMGYFSQCKHCNNRPSEANQPYRIGSMDLIPSLSTWKHDAYLIPTIKSEQDPPFGDSVMIIQYSNDQCFTKCWNYEKRLMKLWNSFVKKFNG